MVGYLVPAGAGVSADHAREFLKGLGQTGFIEGQNVTVEYRSYTALADNSVADLVRRRVAVIVAGGILPTRAAMAATTMIPIVFAVSEDPVKLGLVASLARPGGNATGVNFFSQEVIGKRLGLLHDLVPKAVRIAVLNDPVIGPIAETTLGSVQEAARIIGLQIRILNAGSIPEIDAAFATMAQERPDALFVGANGFFQRRRVQIATLAARERIPAAYADRESVAAGGLMSYGTSFADTFRQIGIYTGTILKGTKPADLPVVQSTRFEFVINLSTARAIGIEVPPQLLAITDEVIE